MKISDSDILLDSSRMYLEKNEEKESLRIWAGNQDKANIKDRVTISLQARTTIKEMLAEKHSEECDVDVAVKQEVSLKKLIVEVLSGREVKIARCSRSRGVSVEESGNASDEHKAGWGLEYNYEQTHYEREQVGFSAAGVVRTTDGEEIGFALKLEMDREFISKNNINIRAGDAAIDPLVINFDGKAADLTNMSFSFDLDSDGVEEELPVPAQGRGFLALDLNGDGIINNGKELFGPRTGEGFEELKSYDADNNNWIDENDDVYSSLQVMNVDYQGSMTSTALKDRGVGAIYLGNRQTRFDIRTNIDNQLLGQVRTSGIYLREDGTPGTIQQLDLVV